MGKILTKPLKVRRMGSSGSAEITIPKEVVSIMKLNIGDYVSFDFYMETNEETFFVVHKREQDIELIKKEE